MKKITLKQNEYFDRKDILIEVEESIAVEPVTKTNVYSVGNLEATIVELRRRQKESFDKFEEEIALNQDILDRADQEIKSVSISKRLEKKEVVA